ncbi:hypothetical protein [Legionella fairfieldensis]|uniref:hypothetical protein n=1 Tax=Legionella fairfieldensis TaxID=45064 RepID=UPI0004921B9C|nr:hypothetical protein [Legionella fairfieldensis]
MNTGITIRNNQYEDITHGSYGFMALFLPMGFLFFFYFQLIGIYLIISTQPTITEDYIMKWAGFFIISTLTIWFGSSSIYAFQTIQFIECIEENIIIRFYFCRKLTFCKKDLVKIGDFKITKLMSRIRTFPEGGTGFLIHLKNGKRYRVSPHMARFEELKAVLTEIVARNK